MSTDTESKLIELFNQKIDAIDEKFEEERKKQKTLINRIVFTFLIFIIGISFYSGVMMNKLNSLQTNQYEVDRKVELLYMVALKKGDITLDMVGSEILTRSGNNNNKN